MVNVVVLNVNIFSPFIMSDLAGTQRVKNLIEPLIEEGKVQSAHNLVVLNLLEKDKIGKKGTTGMHNYLLAGYKSFANPVSFIRFLRMGMRFLRKNKIKNAKNVIYNYQYPDVRNIWFLLYGRLIGYKIVFDLVEDMRFVEAPGFKAKIRNYISLFFVKLIPYFSNAVIAISSHIEERVKLLYGKKIKIYTLPITVNLKYFPNVTFEKPQDGIIKMFYGGTYAAKDGLEFLIESFHILSEKYPNLRLVLTGKGRPEDVEKIKRLAANNPNIIFKGFLQTDEYYKLLNSCQICCMTRNNSAFANAGFPFKLGEFLAAGKAVIASDIGDVKKYLVDRQNAFIVKPESVADITDAVTFYVENFDALVSVMGMEARKTAERNFDTSVLSNKLFEVFSNI